MLKIHIFGALVAAWLCCHAVGMDLEVQIPETGFSGIAKRMGKQDEYQASLGTKTDGAPHQANTVPGDGSSVSSTVEDESLVHAASQTPHSSGSRSSHEKLPFARSIRTQQLAEVSQPVPSPSGRRSATPSRQQNGMMPTPYAALSVPTQASSTESDDGGLEGEGHVAAGHRRPRSGSVSVIELRNRIRSSTSSPLQPVIWTTTHKNQHTYRKAVCPTQHLKIGWKDHKTVSYLISLFSGLHIGKKTVAMAKAPKRSLTDQLRQRMTRGEYNSFVADFIGLHAVETNYAGKPFTLTADHFNAVDVTLESVYAVFSEKKARKSLEPFIACQGTPSYIRDQPLVHTCFEGKAKAEIVCDALEDVYGQDERTTINYIYHL